jgi:hypothetical protein
MIMKRKSLRIKESQVIYRIYNLRTAGRRSLICWIRLRTRIEITLILARIQTII